DIHVSAEAGADLAAVSKIVSKPGSFEIDFKDFGASIVDAASLELSIADQKVAAKTSKTADTTTVIFTPASSYEPGSQHRYEVKGTDTKGNQVGNKGTFSVP